MKEDLVGGNQYVLSSEYMHGAAEASFQSAESARQAAEVARQNAEVKAKVEAFFGGFMDMVLSSGWGNFSGTTATLDTDSGSKVFAYGEDLTNRLPKEEVEYKALILWPGAGRDELGPEVFVLIKKDTKLKIRLLSLEKKHPFPTQEGFDSEEYREQLRSGMRDLIKKAYEGEGNIITAREALGRFSEIPEANEFEEFFDPFEVDEEPFGFHQQWPEDDDSGVFSDEDIDYYNMHGHLP